MQIRWLAEVRVVKGTVSSADIWLGDHRLVIMLDGEGHFARIHGSPVWKQREIDDRFNAAAKKAGLHVLRLHFADLAEHEEVIVWAIAQCQKAEKPLLMLSFYFWLGPECKVMPD